jgi:hypothetical protein
VGVAPIFVFNGGGCFGLTSFTASRRDSVVDRFAGKRPRLAIVFCLRCRSTLPHQFALVGLLVEPAADWMMHDGVTRLAQPFDLKRLAVIWMMHFYVYRTASLTRLRL